MKNFGFLCILILWGCGPDPIPDPEAVVLLAPDNLNSCTTASRINNLERQVRFQWTAALNAESYELIVQNNLTQEQFSSSTSLLNAVLILPGGAPYRWFIRSKSSLTPVSTKSESWQFYLEGDFTTSHFPFPAILLAPANTITVSLSNENNFLFQWEGNDLDDDIVSYDLYLGTEANQLMLEQEGILGMQTTVELISAETYYWQIISFDSQQNKSESAVFEFQTD